MGKMTILLKTNEIKAICRKSGPLPHHLPPVHDIRYLRFKYSNLQMRMIRGLGLTCLSQLQKLTRVMMDWKMKMRPMMNVSPVTALRRTQKNVQSNHHRNVQHLKNCQATTSQQLEEQLKEANATFLLSIMGRR